MRILLIDDDDTIAQFLEGLLTKVAGGPGGCEVRRASRIFDALARLDVEPRFDAILLDLGLPECQGLTSLTVILAHAPGVPVVIVTATESRETADEALQAGACDYLVKGRFGAPRLEQALALARDGGHSVPSSPQLRGAFLRRDLA